MTPDLERLLSAMSARPADEAAVLAAYGDFVRACGLDHFTFGWAVADAETGAIDAKIWTSMPDAWMEEYDGLGYSRHDFVLLQTQQMSAERPLLRFEWGETDAERATISGETRQVLRGVADAGLRNAVSYLGAVDDASGSRFFGMALGGMDGSHDRVVERIEDRRNELLIAAFAMGEVLRPALERWAAGVEAALTPREVDVLARFAQGLRPDAIAHALGVSRRTVDMHAVNARRKLKAQTMAEATARAIRFGFI